mgnify:CR=1 FL=1
MTVQQFKMKNGKLKMKKNNEVLDLSYKFSLLIIDTYKYLIKRKEYVMSKQLLRSGTSIGANITESQAAQSKADFISKMSISLKEAWETRYWIRLLEDSKYLSKYPKLPQIKKNITPSLKKKIILVAGANLI